jgi:hypothetical protein
MPALKIKIEKKAAAEKKSFKKDVEQLFCHV